MGLVCAYASELWAVRGYFVAGRMTLRRLTSET